MGTSILVLTSSHAPKPKDTNLFYDCEERKHDREREDCDNV